MKRNQRLRDSHNRGHKKISKPEAKGYALKLLSYRSRSKRELLQRLKEKGFDSEEIERAIACLEDAGFIKDEELAHGLFQNALERKYLGRKGIKMLLLRRGIRKELINETLSNLTEEMEQESAKRLVEKKLRTLKACPEEIIRQKLWRMLERRGFSPDVINYVIKSIYKSSN